MKIEYTCKICQQPKTFSIEHGQSCDPVWMATFQKMLVCNRCYDLREKFRKAEQQIIRSCGSLERLAMCGAKEEESNKITERCRIVLLSATRRYAEALAVYRGWTDAFWRMSLADELIAAPANVIAIMKNFREESRNRPHQPALRAVTNDP